MSEDKSTKDDTIKPATNPSELGDKDKSDPNETAAEEPESGGGYGNHAED